MRSWEEPAKKFKARVIQWSKQNLGMACNTNVYRTFCFSVLRFVGQLEHLLSSVLQDELWALRRVASGPGNLWKREDLFMLRHGYGFPFSFPSLRCVSMASRARVLVSAALDYKELLEK